MSAIVLLWHGNPAVIGKFKKQHSGATRINFTFDTSLQQFSNDNIKKVEISNNIFQKTEKKTEKPLKFNN